MKKGEQKDVLDTVKHRRVLSRIEDAVTPGHRGRGLQQVAGLSLAARCRERHARSGLAARCPQAAPTAGQPGPRIGAGRQSGMVATDGGLLLLRHRT